MFQWLHLAQQLLLKQCDFLIIDISQGSVATHLGCGGVFKCDFVTNFLLSLTVKIFENRLTFSRVTDRIIVSCFFDSQCSCDTCGQVKRHQVVGDSTWVCVADKTDEVLMYCDWR